MSLFILCIYCLPTRTDAEYSWLFLFSNHLFPSCFHGINFQYWSLISTGRNYLIFHNEFRIFYLLKFISVWLLYVFGFFLIFSLWLCVGFPAIIRMFILTFACLPWYDVVGGGARTQRKTLHALESDHFKHIWRNNIQYIILNCNNNIILINNNNN